MLLAEFRNESRGTNPNARAVTRRVHASPPWSLELHTAGDGLRREGGMSVEIMAQAWRVPCPSPATKLVLVALADNANDQGVCWPSVPHIARKCNLTDRAVQLAIAALASDGHITTDRRTGRATYYAVHPRTDFTPERISPPNTVHRGGEHSSPVVVNTVHQGGEHSSPRTIIEPSLEPSRGERAPPAAKSQPESKPYPEAFERFWAVYPPGRKAAKRKAFLAWGRAIRRADPERIIAAAAEYAASPLGRSEFVAGPEPWLNGDRWDDDRSSWQRDGVPQAQADPALAAAEAYHRRRRAELAAEENAR